jgi:hypothetical protein
MRLSPSVRESNDTSRTSRMITGCLVPVSYYLYQTCISVESLLFCIIDFLWNDVLSHGIELTIYVNYMYLSRVISSLPSLFAIFEILFRYAYTFIQMEGFVQLFPRKSGSYCELRRLLHNLCLKSRLRHHGPGISCWAKCLRMWRIETNPTNHWYEVKTNIAKYFGKWFFNQKSELII